MMGRRSEPEEAHVADLVTRKLTRYAVDGGHGTSVRYSNLVARLRSQPYRPRRTTAVLELLEQLAFTAGPSTAPAPVHLAFTEPVQRQSSSDSSGRPTNTTVASKPSLHVPDLTRPGSNGPRSNDQHSAKSQAAAAVATSESSTSKAKGKEPAATTTSVGGRGDVSSSSSSSALQVQGRLPRKVLAQRWREKVSRPEIPEEELLRDVIFILQGISGRFVRFEEEHGEGGQDAEPEKVLKVKFDETEGAAIPEPTRRVIHRLAELGRLYRRVSEFSQSRVQAQGVGLIMQSLCHFISSELTEYYRLIAILEAQLNHGTSRGGDSSVRARQTEEGQGREEASTGLTLKRLTVWTQDMTLRMRLTSTMIESCRQAHGGALVSLIHSYTFNGDPFIQRFTSQLLDQVSKPFFHSLSRWIFDGELEDPFHEFFVELNSDPSNGVPPAAPGEEEDKDNNSNNLLYLGDSVDAASLWQNKFVFRKEMLPSFLGETFGRKIFSTGKSLNFIRHSCGDSDWVDTRHKLSISGRDLRYSDLVGLEHTIDTVFTIASKRLLDIFLDKFKLLDHLRALKDYLMLSRGDFVDLLMRSLSSSLSRPASSLFRHNLTASLETAVRGSNAQYDDPDILKRLDARILEFVTGDTGWDTFTLEYKVDSPVNTVLDTQAMVGYQTIFSHLWKIKRVELALNSSWTRLNTSCGTLLRLDRGSLRNESHRALVQLAEMIHFVRQLQGFCQLEVIDYSWDDLQNFFSRREGDLDELIQSHRAYLNALIAKVLLRGGKRGAQDQLAQELRSQFDTMLAFSNAADDLAHHVNGYLSSVEMGIVSLPKMSGKRIEGKQQGGRASSRPTTPAADSLHGIRERLDEHSSTFQERTRTIITSLEKHANLTVRELGV
ncbi:hypothetical protein IE53DRAFT_336133, partial [Violaceomyces palustris]